MTVYLVGAGPGDPGLVTLRAASLLARADLVVHDRLVDERVLALAPLRATRIDVGKRSGAAQMSQEEINALLVNKGNDGVVVRLKGGDPYLLGRGGEEALALAASGIDYEVVPGLSAALAVPALAGVPVTLRGVASAVVILTGHDPEHTEGLGELARSGATLVVLMGGATRARLARCLLDSGMDPATPVAAIESGTLPAQHSVRTTLQGLTGIEVHSPVTLVIGAVASSVLYSLETRPLSGLRVVVTRRPEQADALLSLLEGRGAVPVLFPTIEIGPPRDGGAALREVLGRLGDFDWVVLASTNAVEALFAELTDARALHPVRVAAVGRETARELARRGVVADLVPELAGAEGLLGHFPVPNGPERVLLPRAEAGRERLESGLLELGYGVEAVAAYATTHPAVAPEALSALAGAHAVLFASPSAVEGYLELAGRELLPGLVISIGPQTSARLSAGGIAVSAEAATPSAQGLVEALESRMSRGPERRFRIES